VENIFCGEILSVWIFLSVGATLSWWGGLRGLDRPGRLDGGIAFLAAWAGGALN